MERMVVVVILLRSSAGAQIYVMEKRNAWLPGSFLEMKFRDVHRIATANPLVFAIPLASDL